MQYFLIIVIRNNLKLNEKLNIKCKKKFYESTDKLFRFITKNAIIFSNKYVLFNYEIGNLNFIMCKDYISLKYIF